jgi:hypothetical protein
VAAWSKRAGVGLTVVALVAAGLLGSAGPSARGHSGVELRNSGTAIVDGVISDGEYGFNEQGCSDLTTVTVPASGRGNKPTTYHVKACETNDLENDFYAFSIDDLTPDPGGGDAIGWFFDDEHDGTVKCVNEDEPGLNFQDAIAANLNPGSGTASHIDLNYCTDANKTISGLGADIKIPDDITSDITFTPGQGYVIEMSHPLHSGDAEDYALDIHSTVGFCVVYNDWENHADDFFGEIDFPPGCFIPKVDGEKFGDIAKKSPWADLLEKLKGLVDSCEPCPPKLISRLDEIVLQAVSRASANDDAAVAGTLRDFVRKVTSFRRAGKISKSTARALKAPAKEIIASIEASLGRSTPAEPARAPRGSPRDR